MIRLICICLGIKPAYNLKIILLFTTFSSISIIGIEFFCLKKPLFPKFLDIIRKITSIAYNFQIFRFREKSLRSERVDNLIFFIFRLKVFVASIPV